MTNRTISNFLRINSTTFKFVFDTIVKVSLLKIWYNSCSLILCKKMEGGIELEKTSLLIKWKQLNDSHNEKWSTVLLFLLSSSFALTDWMFGIFTFTEYVLLFIGGCLVISGHYQIKLNQIKWILLIIGVILANILINELNNEPFVLKVGLAGLIKVTFYLMVNVGLYNYVMNYGLEEKLLKMMNSVAVVVGIIGIYITIALYSDGLLPYEFFWTYTRTDVLSYSFNAIENLVRTRSVFSEPSFEKTRTLGEQIALLSLNALRSSDTLKVLEPISLQAKSIQIPLENKVFRLASAIGLLQRGLPKWFVTRTEVAALRLGPAEFISIPGEIYPEIIYGGIESPPGQDFLSDPVEVPPLKTKMKNSIHFYLGLSNDEIGYIIPYSEWDAEEPWLYLDQNDTYGEENSLGPQTAPIIYDEISQLLDALNNPNH